MSWLNQHMLPSKWLGHSGAASTLLDDLHCWHAGEDATDSHSTKDMTENNSPTYTAGKVGNDITLVNASSQTLSHDNTDGFTDFDGIAAFSVSQWLQRDDISSTWMGISVRSPNNTGAGCSHVFQQVDGTFYANVSNGNSDSYNTYTSLLLADTRYHLAVVYNGGESTNADRVKVYLDNVLIAPSSTTLTLPAVTNTANEAANYVIGGYGNSIDTFDGQIGEVGLWTRALTIAEIAELYNSGAGLAYPG